MATRLVAPVEKWRFKADSAPESLPDLLVVEEPLEIRLTAGLGHERVQKSLSVTMRTPGHDFELALGFLYSEGILQSYDQVDSIRYCTEVKDKAEEGNVLLVALKPTVEVDWKRLERNFYTSSSCGVCGKSSIEAVQAAGCPILADHHSRWSQAQIGQWDAQARALQVNFKHTGGIHAATLWNAAGEIVLQREDVGRHNAVDKVLGAMLAQGKMPLAGHALMVSGRAGFELVQKAAMAAIPLMAAVGAPSHLAVQLAEERGMTLIGFLRGEQFNVYSHPERVLPS